MTHVGEISRLWVTENLSLLSAGSRSLVGDFPHRPGVSWWLSPSPFLFSLCVCAHTRARVREKGLLSLGILYMEKTVEVVEVGFLVSLLMNIYLFIYHKSAGVLETPYVLTWVEYLYVKTEMYI